jgi:endonuclease III
MAMMPDHLEVLGLLEKEYPRAPKVALDFKSPLQLLVATILSAQCTDERVNRVTEDLFKKYRTASDFAGANLKEFEDEIRSTGFYHNKAKNIKAAAMMIVNDFGGKVPDTMDNLIKLPGVARKTANIVLTAAYGKIEGIAVDTHVLRLSHRIGLAKTEDPVKVEKELMAKYPREKWGVINKVLVAHGRSVCKALKPRCTECKLARICQKIGVKVDLNGKKHNA